MISTPPVIPYERTVLAGVMADPVSADRICELLQPSDFLDQTHRSIFACVVALSVKRGDTGVQSVGRLAHALGVSLEVVYDIAAEGGTEAHTLNAGRIVLAASQLRSLALLLTDLAASAQSSVVDPSSVATILEQARRGLEEIAGRSPAKHSVKAVDAEPELLPRVMQNEPTPQGIRTGFYDLDKGLGGLRKGEMIVLAARPSVGKSLFAANIAENVCEGAEPIPVLFFSMEMSASALYRRALFGRAGVSSRNALNGRASPEEKRRLQRAHDDLAKMPFYFHVRGTLTPQDIHIAARRFQAERGPCLIVVDYLQLMRGDGGSRVEQVTNISMALKGIAQDLDCPLLVLSQLSRNAAEERDPRTKQIVIKVPTLPDLRESGAIEQDADVVVFLSRDITTQGSHETDLVLAKNRPGQTTKTTVLFDPNGPRFRNVSRVEHFDGKS